MKHTKPFSQLSKNDAHIAGGKGASLGEMLQAGIPVPDGFVVLADTFEYFLHKADLIQEIEAILSSVDHNAIHTVDAASEQIQDLIIQAQIPIDITTEIQTQFYSLHTPFVAVRSSATAEDGAEHAWAGQLDSYLNVTADSVLEKVQHCWASLFTPRAIFYRFEKGLDTTKISVAVVVQKMVNSEKSGIAFSVHPVTEDKNQIIIEAGYGLGEAVVSGSITPDSYVVTKNPRKILDINISEQTKALYRKSGGGNEWIELGQQGEEQVLTETEIQELSAIIITIENHYGFPCDIEWAYEDNTFYIVQSRPITTLAEKKSFSDKATEISMNFTDTHAAFTLSYSRDTTLFMQELWSKSLIKMPEERFGWQNPYLPLIAHYENEGVVEIWQNMMALGWLLDKFYEENIKSTEFVEKLFAEYTDILISLKEVRSNGLLTESNIQIYCDQVSKAIFIITTFIYIGTDERTPDNIKDICVRARELEDLFSDNDLYIRQSLKINSNLTAELASVVLASEFNNIPKEDVLKSRVKNYLLIDGQETYLGKLSDFKKINKKVNFIVTEHEVSKFGEIIGQSAFGGYAKGIVKIVKKYADIKNVEEGDILVSPMTTPDFLTAMKKAAAFITDEGGVTCHAAIVSRELKKPCIVGTKNATQILKDGDLVEVDADNGVVRVLEKAYEPEYKEIEFVKNTHLLDVYTLELAWSDAAKRTDLNLVPLEVILVFKDGNLKLYCDDVVWQENAKRSFYSLAESEILRSNRIERSQAYTNDLKLYIEKIKNTECTSLLETHLTIQDFLYRCMLSFAEENFPGLHSNLLSEQLNIIVGDSDIASDILIPNSHSYFKRYEIELLELANKIENDTLMSLSSFDEFPVLIQKDIESLVKKYGWISAGFNERPKDINNIISELQDIFATEVPIKKIQEDMSSQFEADMEKKILIEKKLQRELSESDWSNVELIQALVGDAKYRIELGLELIYISRVIYEKIGKENGLSLYEMKYLFPQEITDLLQGKIEISEIKKVISVRTSKEYIISIKGGVCAELDNFVSSEKQQNQLKGQKAHGGIVTGIVKIVNSPEENYKVRMGDVMVSSRTSPELVPAMAKAGAIISELGGLLCHASIVSREMKKTCIVGVKRATEVLKDGDMVEVNAETGIVKIIIN